MATENEAKAIIAAHEDALMRLPNVTGLGIVSDKKTAAGVAIAVYVRAKRLLSDLRADDVVPKILSTLVDGKTVEAQTRVIEIGEIKF